MSRGLWVQAQGIYLVLASFLLTHVQDYAWCVQCTCMYVLSSQRRKPQFCDHRKKVPECNVWWRPDKRTTAAEKTLEGLWVQTYCYSNHLEPTSVCKHAVGNLKSREGQRWRRMQLCWPEKRTQRYIRMSQGLWVQAQGTCQMSEVSIKHPSYLCHTWNPNCSCQIKILDMSGISKLLCSEAPFFHSTHLRNETEPAPDHSSAQKPLYQSLTAGWFTEIFIVKRS